MSIPLNSHNNFIIVGENIHATRVLRLNGKRIGENEKGTAENEYKTDEINSENIK